MTLLSLLALLSLLLWAGLLALRDRFWRADQDLPEAPGDLPAEEVLALIPARDEADLLPKTLPAVLAQAGSARLSVMVIDDHSTDGTAEVARRLAADHPGARVEVIAAPPRPEGWSGKLWALESGLRAAGADAPRWLWLIDADIAPGPNTLARLRGAARAGNRGLVSVMARLDAGGGWGRLLIPAFVFFFQKLYPFPAVNDPARRTAAAAGGCLLLDRQRLAEAGGFPAIADQIIDDCALARRLKARGPIWLGFDDDVKSLRPYPGLAGIWEMVARTAYVELDQSPAKLAGTVAGMGLLYLVPPLATLAGVLGGAPLTALLGLAAWGLIVRAGRPTAGRFAGPVGAWISAAALPLAGVMYSLMTLDSARRFRAGRGGAWKGRTAPPGARRDVPPADPDTARAEAVVKAAGTSFYWAMRALPAPRRAGMFALYGFCRLVDDIADDDHRTPEARRAELTRWRARVRALSWAAPQQLDDPLARALVVPGRRFGLPEADLLAVIDGMEMDAEGAIVAPDWATLDLYCDRVASAVGRLSNRIFGAPPELNDPIAHHLGRALQLTNILRDVAEDAARGRLYLPAEALAAAGIPAPWTPETVLADPRLPAAGAWLAERARAHFHEADALLARTDPATMFPALVMRDVYKATFDRLETVGFGRPEHSPRFSKRAKLALLMGRLPAVLKARLRPPGD
ncbi:presqualene diphosphate synthase HpnD [Roseospirillum parvum]|uniref:Squalene synthase HpnD n=1 Tax=Roseospirillum parvum TaxID=83401 RepID=A0A1G8CKQ2_9PROT|nr:presqualene diphosphate synthase HpnD [Roseospirillum parvum]SDH46015.1 squalene synthase HpnD [Roseospirillum parvum]